MSLNRSDDFPAAAEQVSQVSVSTLSTSDCTARGRADYLINEIVYQLYDLTDEEIAIVEGED